MHKHQSTAGWQQLENSVMSVIWACMLHLWSLYSSVKTCIAIPHTSTQTYYSKVKPDNFDAFMHSFWSQWVLGKSNVLLSVRTGAYGRPWSWMDYWTFAISVECQNSVRCGVFCHYLPKSRASQAGVSGEQVGSNGQRNNSKIAEIRSFCVNLIFLIWYLDIFN